MKVWVCSCCKYSVRRNERPDPWRIVPDGDGKRGCPQNEWEEHQWVFDHEDEN